LVVAVVVVLIHIQTDKQKVVEMVDHMLVEEMPEIQLTLEHLAPLEQVVVEVDILLEMDIQVVLE
jgi:hypothetical protein